MVKVYLRPGNQYDKVSANFNAGEFFCHCGKCNPQKIDDDLVTALQRIRTMTGTNVHVNCGYRCPKHNAEVGGSPKSQHMEGKAADIRNSAILPVVYAQLAELDGMQGIGLYNTFTHLDVRAGKKYKGYWGNGKKCLGYPATFFLTVKKGMKNADCNLKMPIVSAAQYMLNLNGADLKIDGSFGEASDKALRSFQSSHGLKVDGLCGNKTWKELYKIWTYKVV